MLTHAGVVPRLLNGADLFLPGVLPPSDHFRSLKSNQKRSVQVASNGMVVGVGLTCVDATHIRTNGMVGVGLQVLHRYGDYLWQFGPAHLPPQEIQRLSALELAAPDQKTQGTRSFFLKVILTCFECHRPLPALPPLCRYSADRSE